MQGERFANRYLVQGELGRGGVGRVLLAFDTLRDHRPVALKLLRVDGRETDHSEALSREFELMTHLRHPNLVEVYDYAVAPECFFSMEYVEGRELRAVHLDDEELCESLIQVCRALEYIHSRGLVHLDIKPSNLLFSRASEGVTVKLMDFGVSTYSQSGALRGYTIGYVAPEVIERREFDGRADLFALGMTIGLQRREAMLDGDTTATAPHSDSETGTRTRSALPLTSYDLLPPILRPIVERLVRNDPNERYASAAQVIEALAQARGTTIPVETAATRGGYLAASRLSGREAELALLQRSLGDAVNGEARLVYVCGPSGVGKTRLVSELRVEAQLRGALVLESRSSPDESTSYGVVRRWLTTLVPLCAQHLDEETRRELERFVSDDRGRMTLEEWASEALGSRLGDAILAIITETARLRELVLIVEDEQWADRASRAMLRRLGTAIARGRLGRLLLVMTARLDEAPRDLAGQVIHLGPLGGGEIAQLVAALVGREVVSANEMARIATAAAGSSLYVCELLRQLADESLLTRGRDGWRLDANAFAQYVLPATVEELIERRLQSLSPTLQRTLGAAAALGEVFLPAVLTSTTPPLGSRVDLLELTARNFLVAEGRRLRFGHAMIREVALAAMPERVADWPRLLAALAAQLEHESGEPADVARLYAASATPWRALPALAEAVRRARALFDYDAAVDLLAEEWALVVAHRASVSSPDEVFFAVEIDWLEAVRRAGRSDVVDVGAMVEHPASLAPERQALLRLELAQLAHVRGQYAEVEEHATRALGLLAPVAIKQRALGHRLRGLARYHEGQLREAAAELDEAVAVAQSGRDVLTQVAALTDRGFVHGYASDYRRAVADHEAALARFAALPDGEEAWFARAAVENNLGFACWSLGRYDAASRHLGEALALRRKTRDRYGEGITRNNLGNVARHLGLLGEAADQYTQAIQLCRSTGNRLYEAIAQNNLGQIRDEEGEYAAAETLYREALATVRQLGDRIREGDNLGSLGASLVERGEIAEACVVLEQARAVREAIGDRAYLIIDLSFLARAQAALSRVDAAKASLAAAEQLLAAVGEGVEQVQVVHLNEFYAYRALGDEEAAARELVAARTALATQAAMLGDDDARRRFLARRLHKQIAEAQA